MDSAGGLRWKTCAGGREIGQLCAEGCGISVKFCGAGIESSYT